MENQLKLLKKEIDIAYNIADLWTHYKKGAINFNIFVERAVNNHMVSSINCDLGGHMYFLDFLYSLRYKPSTGSGSAIEAIMDYDGIWSALESEWYDECSGDIESFLNHLYAEGYGYFKSKKSKLNNKQKMESNKNNKVNGLMLDTTSKISILDGDIEIDVRYLIHIGMGDCGEIVAEPEITDYQNVKYLGNPIWNKDKYQYEWRAFDDFKTYIKQFAGIDLEKEIEKAENQINLDVIIKDGKKYCSLLMLGCIGINNKS
jgi:hypothetical protein